MLLTENMRSINERSAIENKIVVVSSGPGPRCKNRRLEWYMTVTVILIAIALSLSPHAIERSRFFLLTEYGIDQRVFLLYTISVGYAGALALFFNGRMPYGYWIRVICAGLRSILWANMALALAATSSIEAFSITVPVLGMLAIAEIDSAYRALVDQGNAARDAAGNR